MTSIEDLLERKFEVGSRIINCVVHADMELTKRPDDCRLCLADLRNHMSLAIRTNEWLNEWKTDATEILKRTQT
jgi:hypothetical protein